MFDKIKEKAKEKLSGDSSGQHGHNDAPEKFDHTHAALDHVTDKAGDHSEDPLAHMHMPADHATAHSWLASYFPTSGYLEDIESSHNLGNWVRIDRATGQTEWEPMSIYVRLGMHALYYGAYQQHLLESGRVKNMLKAQSEKMGKQYDDPASRDHIQPFIRSFKLDMSEMVEPDPDKYPTFNAFFGREIKPSARPPASPEDPSVISSAADCRLSVWPTIDLATEIWIKGANFTLERLLQDADLARQCEGGAMAIFRLAPQDYHRWHAPVSGTISSVKDIDGTYHTVNPQAIRHRVKLNVYCENKRSVMVIDTVDPQGRTVPVVLVAVGAMLVGSIKYIKNTPGEAVKRGECLGAFYYGGSTVLAIFPKRSVTFDDDLVAWSSGKQHGKEVPTETLVKVGEKIAKWD